MADLHALSTACLLARFDRFERRLLTRLGGLLVLQHVLLFAALHLGSPHG